MERMRERWREIQDSGVGGTPTNRWLVVRQWIWVSWWLYIWVGMLVLAGAKISGTSFRVAGLDVSGFIGCYFVALGVYIVFAVIYYPIRWVRKVFNK